MIGYRTLSLCGTSWRMTQRALIPQRMPHVPLCPDEAQLGRSLLRAGALLARWDVEFDSAVPGEWWHVIKDEEAGLDALSGSTRSKIRRGGRKLAARRCSRAEVLECGHPVYRAAFERYETFEPCLSRDAFCEAVQTLPEETEFWAVTDLETDDWVAFSENLVRDEACFYNTIWFAPEGLRKYSSYLLFQKMNEHYLVERGLRYVSDGARSISHDTSIHDFLIDKFHFRKAYSRLRVCYAPGLGLLVRILYPWRERWSRGTSSISRKLTVLLEQERIRRACLRRQVPSDGP